MTMNSIFKRLAWGVSISIALLSSAHAQSTNNATNTPSTAVESTQASEINWAQYKGKVVYIDFWASWCGPCRESFPWMNAMQEKYGKDGLVILAINVDSEPQKAAQFLSENLAKFTIKYDAKGKVAEQFGVQTMPSSFVLDRQGKPSAKHMGFHTESAAEYENELKGLLAQKL